MQNNDEDDDLKLVKASAVLLQDLEQDLPKVLWKAPITNQSQHGQKRVHSRVRRRDLDRVVNLIEPFQAEPQLLDAKLKTLLPPIIDAYLESLQRNAVNQSDYVNIESAVCTLLYTLCKVRGYKIVAGFLNNEPRYLELILEALEKTLRAEQESLVPWQVPYVLLLWLSHLLLAPFDLISISTKDGPLIASTVPSLDLPPLPARVLNVGLSYLYASTKAQEAAASMIIRLCIRPDVVRLRLADSLVWQSLNKLESATADNSSVYETIGSLRFTAGVVAATELSHLVPDVYQRCCKFFNSGDLSDVATNAVAKKLAVKIFRNIAVLSMRSATSHGLLLEFVQTSDVLETVIDYLLRALGDKDTPVRNAAAKAISLIVIDLEPAMAHDVIQAVLDSFKEDMPKFMPELDLATVNPLKWHGLTLTLAQCLFNRSASPEQLPDIFDALIAALQFQQRTTTGSSLGTNVRDAANFGIWSLARRYTTAELLPVPMMELHVSNQFRPATSVIQVLAIHLILSACLDPAGNIRRGSSAALQELVGRHPDEVYDGIALVQIVDYQAVSLRKRAMVNVLSQAATLQPLYQRAALTGLFGWRGVCSPDVSSREWAAAAIANLTSHSFGRDTILDDGALVRVLILIREGGQQEVESLHGHTLTAAMMLQRGLPSKDTTFAQFLNLLSHLKDALKEWSPRLLRSELPAAVARFITALCQAIVLDVRAGKATATPAHFEIMEELTEKIMARHEDWILGVIPDMAKSILDCRRATNVPLGIIGMQILSERVTVDGFKNTLNGAGRAIALGALAAQYSSSGLVNGDAAMAVASLSELVTARNVDWRVIGARALQLVVASAQEAVSVDAVMAEAIYSAIHCGLNDYTIDERGDIGSLVRLQCISCAAELLGTDALRKHVHLVQLLAEDIFRLSLEKLDRVRQSAAKVRNEFLHLGLEVTDLAGVSSIEYFDAALSSLAAGSPEWQQRALLEGCISCSGMSAENILQASRHVLVYHFHQADAKHLEHLLNLLATTMKDCLVQTASLQPHLEVLAFLLDMQVPQRLATGASSSTFKWRNLLSTVQKSHHKSNDLPKVLTAVHVYSGLTEVPSIRGEVMKKLVSMLKTNPYPRVRVSVAEALYVATRDDAMKACDWNLPVAQNASVVAKLLERYL